MSDLKGSVGVSASIARVIRKKVGLFIIKVHTLWNIESCSPCEIVLLFSCPDSWEQDQLHPVFPELGLAGQQAGETGIFIRYYGKHQGLIGISERLIDVYIYIFICYSLIIIVHFVPIITNTFSDLSGILEVLHCILLESPEALNIIQRSHIKSIISLLYKHGRNHKVGRSMHAVANQLWVFWTECDWFKQLISTTALSLT